MPLARVLVGVSMVAAAVAQSNPSAELVARVRGGGVLDVAQYRRGKDGDLEILSCAMSGDPARRDFTPVVRPGFADFHPLNLGKLGLLALLCHGDSDLLAMTDAELHFAALDTGTSDENLRHFLAVPPPAFDGAAGRAALLDRMLAIDLLRARNCRAAVAECRGLAGDASLPEALRVRAAEALRAFEGKPAIETRRRLEPAQLRLPESFDACMVVDHARLPDMRWLMPLRRRLAMLSIVGMIERYGGAQGVATSALSASQRMCDYGGEAPFWLAHHLGNARIDHSVVVMQRTSAADSSMAFTWQAAGAFELAGWREAKVPEGVDPGNWLLGGRLDVAATALFASTGPTAAKPGSTLATSLLRDEGHAVRIVVPGDSGLWRSLAHLRLPPAKAAELRVDCGDPAVLVLAVTANDAATAQAWVVRGKELLAEAEQALAAMAPDDLANCAEWKGLLRAFAAARFHTEGESAFAAVEIAGLTPGKLQKIGEAVPSAF